MLRKSLSFLALVWICSLSCLPAQDKDPRSRLATAHAQYYTPTSSGLKSFHCDASIDWKAMLSRFSGKDIADDNPALTFLQTAHLAVSDDLRGEGKLEWTNTVEPPAERKAGMQRMQDGFQSMVSGFFQTWNPYMNGAMVPVPDDSLTVTKSGDGVHLSGTSKGTTLDEDYDANMLLTRTLVTSPSLTVVAIPTYTRTDDGLLLAALTSLVHQPPTAPEIDATFRVEYAKVDSYQIPSHVVFDIKNIGIIEFGLSACKVTVADWAKKS